MNEASLLQNPPMNSVKESTKASRASGLAYFTRFCIEAFNVQSLDEMTEINSCDTVMLYSFCTYLIGLTKMNDGESVSLKIGTLWQYLGAAVTYIKGRFPTNVLFGNNQDDWYGAMREDLRKNVADVFIQTGMNITDKAPPIGRTEMIGISCAYMAWNSIDALLRRAALILLFLAVGRGGEIGTASWNQCSYNKDQESLVMEWSQLKTSRQKLMTFHPDRSCFEMDYMHALACIFMFSAGISKYDLNPDAISLPLFPNMANLANGCSSKTTTYIRDLVFPR